MTDTASKVPPSQANKKQNFFTNFKILQENAFHLKVLAGIALLIVLIAFAVDFIHKFMFKITILQIEFDEFKATTSQKLHENALRIFELEEYTHRQSQQIGQLQDALIVLADDDDEEEKKTKEDNKDYLGNYRFLLNGIADYGTSSWLSKERKLEEWAKQAERKRIMIKSAEKYLRNLKRLDSKTKIDEMIESVQKEFQEMRRSIEKYGRNENLKTMGSYDNEGLLKLNIELDDQRNVMKELKKSQMNQEKLGEITLSKLEEVIQSIKELQLKNTSIGGENIHEEKGESKEDDAMEKVLNTIFSTIETFQDTKLDLKTLGKLKGAFENLFSENSSGDDTIGSPDLEEQ